ncbi:hypothetical protein HK405_006756 [Cladochytrium tenue]|nr:hypothetical protein HK405_006756 [Cladochytrium tenue]
MDTPPATIVAGPGSHPTPPTVMATAGDGAGDALDAIAPRLTGLSLSSLPAASGNSLRGGVLADQPRSSSGQDTSASVAARKAARDPSFDSGYDTSGSPARGPAVSGGGFVVPIDQLNYQDLQNQRVRQQHVVVGQRGGAPLQAAPRSLNPNEQNQGYQQFSTLPQPSGEFGPPQGYVPQQYVQQQYVQQQQYGAPMQPQFNAPMQPQFPSQQSQFSPPHQQQPQQHFVPQQPQQQQFAPQQQQQYPPLQQRSQFAPQQQQFQQFQQFPPQQHQPQFPQQMQQAQFSPQQQTQLSPQQQQQQYLSQRQLFSGPSQQPQQYAPQQQFGAPSSQFGQPQPQRTPPQYGPAGYPQPQQPQQLSQQYPQHLQQQSLHQQQQQQQQHNRYYAQPPQSVDGGAGYYRGRQMSLPGEIFIPGSPSTSSVGGATADYRGATDDSFYEMMHKKGHPVAGDPAGGKPMPQQFRAPPPPIEVDSSGTSATLAPTTPRFVLDPEGQQTYQSNVVDWYNMPEPPMMARSFTSSASMHTHSPTPFEFSSDMALPARKMEASATPSTMNSTHPLIFHSPSDPIPGLIANRPVVEIVILLGPRRNRAPSLLAQLQSQMPPSQFPQLRLVGSSSNRYAGVGEYWDAGQAHVLIEGNVPLQKSVRRLKNAVVRAEKVREHVVKNNDISMPMMGWMTATCEDLCTSTEEMSVDFEGEGGVVAVLATCASWTYKGSDGATAVPRDFEPIWEKQFTVSSRVAQVRVELVEPLTDFVTPFASAMCARSRARDGDVASAMMTLLTYEAQHGGPKVAHWVVLRSWGFGSGAPQPGDLLDAAWISAEAAARGTQAQVAAAAAAAGSGAPVTSLVPSALDLTLLPDTTGAVSWSLFARVVPPVQLKRDPGSGATGVEIKAGEYHVVEDVQSKFVLVTQMEALQRVIQTVGSKLALAACGYPHMPDGISPPAFRDLCQFTTRRSRVAFSALAGIMMTRGKKEAVRSLLAAVSLGGRMGNRLEKQQVVVRKCTGGFMIHSMAVQEAIRAAQGHQLSWLCLSGSKVRLVVICTADRGIVRCLGTANFVGALAGQPDGVGVFIA